jgi:tRNA1(Val) A37 N6-methylase TrmN6
MDVKDLVSKFETDTFDIITCNPPYFKKEENSIINDNEIKSIARHEIKINLEEIIKISKKLLKNGGSLNIVHRTDRLIEIIELMRKNNIEPKRIRFIYPKMNSDSNLVLIDGRKNGKTGLKLLPPLYVHNDDGSYTDEIIKMFGK